MVSQYVLIGIVAGVFIAGIGIGYAALQGNAGPMNFGSMSPQHMQQAMQDTNFRQNMMDDPESMRQIHGMMMSNSQHMNQMMGPMMNTMMDDPEMRQQMMGMMSQHNTMMQSMMQNPEMMNMMNSEMMMGQGNGMMSGSGMGQMMISDPELQGQFSQQKLEHQKIMNDLMSADMSDPVIQQKIRDQTAEHQKFMEELMNQINSQISP